MDRYVTALVTVAGLLLIPSSASAGSPPREAMHFELPASNGYTLQVKTERSQTMVSTWSGNRSVGVTYSLHGSVAGTAIDADLGSLGRVDVKFEPSGREVFVTVPTRKGPKCQVRRRLGTFTGTISFHGENGYTTAEATSVPGSIGPPASRGCGTVRAASSEAAPALGRRQVERVWTVPNATLMSRSKSHPGAGADATLLLVSADLKAAYFFAYRLEAPGPQLAISRRVEVADIRSSFFYRRTLRSALIHAPAPFAGEATYSARRGRLSGDLTVEFPGLPPQSLTGPGFEAQMHPVH